MMRYRRNRASTMEGGGGGAQNHPSSSNPTGSQMPQQQQQQQLLPSSIGYGAGASASGAPWTAMYQGSAGMKASGATSGVGGGGSSGLLGAAAAGGRGGGGGGGPPSNWGISYGSNAVTASDGRPKSANFNAGQPTAAASNSLMASLTGAGRPSSSVQPSQVPLSTNWSSQQQQQQSQSGQQQLSINNNSNTLSYGSLKNRFLSGTGGKSNMPSQSSNNNVGASAAAGAGAGNKSSSKLFSLAR